ncbi:MAG: GTP cyclohydrolase I FolE2 [Herminiimonas sp.]|nr:GTP cyclohydrolase I FolE2 [Herminiimonas sp.]
MNAPENKSLLPDVQSIVDQRNIAIQRVGVKSVIFPVKIASTCDMLGATHATVASIDMYVGLPPEVKGTHMSRFLEVLHAIDQPLSFSTLLDLMTQMLQRLGADSGFIEMRMPYFMTKTAPVSGVESLMDYQLTLRVERKSGVTTYTQQVLVPVTSLCPCSKGISAYGAHNQRSHVTIAAQLREAMPIDDLIRIAEGAASCELYGLLKRPDEKYVTERAYDNPKFVEDLVRDIALVLNGDARIVAYTVESENFESIHNHSAYALIEHDKR